MQLNYFSWWLLSKLLVCPLYHLILWWIWYQLCCVPGWTPWWISDVRLEVKTRLQRGRKRRCFVQSHDLFSQNLCHFSPPGPRGKQTPARHQQSGSTGLWDLHHWGCSKLHWTSPWAVSRVLKDRTAWNMAVNKRSPEVLSNLQFFCYYMKSSAIDWPFCIIPVSANNCDTWVMVIAVLTKCMKKAGPPTFTPFNIYTKAFLIYASPPPPQEVSKLHNTSLNETHEKNVTLDVHHLP